MKAVWVALIIWIMLIAVLMPTLVAVNHSNQAKIQDATVMIRSVGIDDTTTGSGAIIRTDGTIVTAKHVVEGSIHVLVETNGGDVYYAEVVSKHTTEDVAILRIPGNNWPALRLSTQYSQGDRIRVIGSPLHFTNYKTAGIVSYTDPLMVDAVVSSGSSGSPIVNCRNQVIGIVVSKVIGEVQFNFAVETKYILEVL